MFFIRCFVDIVKAIHALMMAEVGDAERLTVVCKGFSNQVRPVPRCDRAGRVVDSGGNDLSLKLTFLLKITLFVDVLSRVWVSFECLGDIPR